MPKQLEEYLSTALASIGDAVISTNTEGRIVFANKVALSLLRAAEPQVVGKPLEEVFVIRNEFTRAPVENPIKRVLREGVIAGLASHTVLIARDGTEVPIDDSAAPIRDDTGEIQGAVLVFKDITVRRRAEAISRLLASIVESSDDAIVSKDIHGIITSWNQGAEHIFGYPANEVIGKPIALLAAPDRIDEMPRILARIRNGERIHHYETVRRAKSGKLVNVSLTVSPLYDDEGRIVGASKIARDITDQVRIRAELAEQRERLRVTLTSIADAVITTNDSGIITYMNPVAEQLTSWNVTEATGKRLSEVFCIVNETSRHIVEPALEVIRKGRTVGLENQTVLIARDAQERAIDVSAAPIRNKRDEIGGVVLIFRDVTARRAAEKKLEAQAAELRRANDELNQFAYAVSHDFREPLRNVALFTELLMGETETQPGSRAQDFAQVIIDGLQRMEALMNDLLSYSSLGAPYENEPRITDANAVLRKTLETLKPVMEETGAEITAGPLPQVLVREPQLLQLFQNLIGNALKYHSEQPPRVHISARKTEHCCVFSVRDNGIGVPLEHQKTIFGVFKRLHGKEIPGTGIGLAICAKIVERHGGRIWVDSQAGEGSEFSFTLPVVSTMTASGEL